MKQKLHCAYLFADGHAVLVYEKHDRQAGDIRWAEVVEKFGPECRFTGRIVFHWGSNGLLNLCRKAVLEVQSSIAFFGVPVFWELAVRGFSGLLVS